MAKSGRSSQKNGGEPAPPSSPPSSGETATPADPPSAGETTPADETAPETAISSQPPLVTTTTKASLSFTASESGSSFECELDFGPWVACSSPASYSNLGLGLHTFAVRATDEAGNTDTSPAIATWTVLALPDTTPPDTSIVARPPGRTTNPDASFSFTATESGSTFECRLDSAAWGACASPASYPDLAVGQHTFAVRAVDAAGNTDPSPATDSWTVQTPADETPPETTITGQPQSITTDTAASFSFTASESGSTFACKLDSGSWGNCASPSSYSGLSVGQHTFSVRASDGAGNTDLTPATYSWTVQAAADETPPETAITSQPASATTATAASFGFTASESGSTFSCKLDSGSWGSCTSPASYSGLAVGQHTFSVRATDKAANTDPTPATYAWTVEAPVQEPPAEEPPAEEEELRPCSQTVSSISAAQSALGSAATGSVVCLASGTYGSLTLSMKRPAPGVTLRAQNPGQATLGSVTATGAGVTVERFVTGSLSVNAGAERIAYDRNNSTGGVYVIGNTSANAKNVELIGNILNPSTGSGEKDSIQAQRFEALRIENNQIWIADEDGNHNDGLQTVWGGHGLIFRGNWMRGGAGSQGFFLKDGQVTNVTFEDNLIAGRPSKAPYAGAPFQVYETVPNPADPFYTGYGMLMRHNTIWSNPNTSYLRECGNKAVLVEFNVMDGWGAPDGTSCVLSQLTQDYNVITGGTIGKRGPHDVSTTPSFVDSANQDWQLTPTSSGNFSSGRAGVTWHPADRSYGP